MFDSVIDSDAVDKTPSWDAHSSLPPVSIADAVKRCEDCLSTLVSNAKEWKVGRIVLERKYPFQANKWVYKVTFKAPRSDLDRDPFAEIVFPILMDGTVIRPTEFKIPASKR